MRPASSAPYAGPDAHAARQRRRDAYRPALDVLRQLSTGQGNPAAPAALSAGLAPDQAAAPLPAADRAAARAALLKASLAAPDPYFLSCLFDAMVDMGEAGALLAARPPQLQVRCSHRRRRVAVVLFGWG